MPDREKVIKGLECHENKMVCMNHCPYCDGSGSTEDCTDKLIADAFDMLKEQEKEVKALRLLFNRKNKRKL